MTTRRMTWWTCVAACVAVMTLSIGPDAAADEAAAPPNIVIILADDLGYGDLSCYGGWIETPNIDRLAADGVRFTDFHSNGAVCSPTRAALLTGRYPQRAGIDTVVFADPARNRHHGLSPHETTFAELLQSAGYATAIFGKWHLGYRKQFNPVHHGFDLFRGYVSGNVDYFSHIDGAGFFDWWENDQLLDEPGYVTHLITKHAVDFIAANKDRPFCLYIPHEAVHSPYQGPDDQPIRKEGVPMPIVPPRKDPKQAYREMVIEMDQGVGQVLDAIERNGLRDKTLVFFFSDNGAASVGSNGKLRGSKGSLWEGGHRVPAIARWPGRIKPGLTCDQMAIGMDLFPTMLELAGVSTPRGLVLDGASLLPMLLEDQRLPRRTLYWNYGKQSAMREGDWKLLVNPPGLPGTGLYNLSKDPEETTNLAQEQPDRVTMMLHSLESWKQNVTAGTTPQPEAP